MAKKKVVQRPNTETVDVVEEDFGYDRVHAAWVKSLANKAAKCSKFSAALMSKEHESWKYMDFWDTKKNRPCLPLEWLFGCRGLMTGRVLQIVAKAGAGKSSLLVHLYGMGTFNKKCLPLLVETEDAPLAPDRVMQLGVDPNRIMKVSPAGMEETLELVEDQLNVIRESIDPKKKLIVVVGIDSISSLGSISLNTETGEVLGGSDSAGIHSRQFSKFFRNKLKLFKIKDAILIATSQLKTDIPMAGTFNRGGPKEVSLADGTFDYHDSWKLRLRKNVEKADGDPKNVITMTMLKNKLAGTAQERAIMVDMYEDERGWDYEQATIRLLFGSFSPFEPGSYKTSGNGLYSHEALASGKSMRKAEFLDEFFANEKLLSGSRENLRIRGFGFKFEDYEPICLDEPEEKTEES